MPYTTISNLLQCQCERAQKQKPLHSSVNNTDDEDSYIHSYIIHSTHQEMHTPTCLPPPYPPQKTCLHHLPPAVKDHLGENRVLLQQPGPLGRDPHHGHPIRHARWCPSPPPPFHREIESDDSGIWKQLEGTTITIALGEWGSSTKILKLINPRPLPQPEIGKPPNGKNGYSLNNITSVCDNLSDNVHEIAAAAKPAGLVVGMI